MPGRDSNNNNLGSIVKQLNDVVGAHVLETKDVYSNTLDSSGAKSDDKQRGPSHLTLVELSHRRNAIRKSPSRIVREGSVRRWTEKHVQRGDSRSGPTALAIAAGQRLMITYSWLLFCALSFCFSVIVAKFERRFCSPGGHQRELAAGDIHALF